MIQKVSLYFIFPMMLLAFFLALVGVEQIEFGDTYYNFIRSVGKSLDNWKLEIPNIPKIDTVDTSTYDSSGLILKVLIKIANFFVNFVNVITGIINVLIGILNILIQLVQFILTLIYQCKDFINRQSDSVVLVSVS